MEKPGQSDFIREMQRLMEAQRVAIQSKDPVAIEDAAADLTHLLRMNAAGRLQEYFASRQQSE